MLVTGPMNEIDVVVLEDDPALLNAITSHLLQERLRVRAFTDPRRALALVLRETPRVVIADHDLPGMETARLLEQVREQLGARAPRFLLVMDASTRRTHRLGADAVVYKPFRLDDLLAQVRTLAGLESDEPREGRESHQRLKRYEEPTSLQAQAEPGSERSGSERIAKRVSAGR
ncbi:Transcriptional regulatory protein QseB [uncultured bacterium]|nr:Transcriptional regulatory protein QseB [uncultured bacterium]